MKFFLDYFGLAIFCFVIFIGCLVAYPALSGMPAIAPGEIVGLVLAMFVVGGGFSWYYFATSHQGGVRRRSPERSE